MADKLLDLRRAYRGETNPILKMAHGEEYAASLEKRLEHPEETEAGEIDPDETEGYDQVRVHFKDGTSTLLQVAEDDDIQEAIVGMCEESGYPVDDVVNYEIEKAGGADLTK